MPILIIDNNPISQSKFGPVKQELIELSVDSIIVLVNHILPGSINLGSQAKKLHTGLITLVP